MRHPAIVLSLSLSIFCIAITGLRGHYQSTREYDDAIRKAKAVAIAEVVSASKKATRCYTDHNFELKPVTALKGPIDMKKIYPFSYTIHEWKRATFPWQEDCPSVHYRLPPIAEKMSKGDRVIITIEYWEPGKTDTVVSTRDIKYLEEVKNLLGK